MKRRLYYLLPDAKHALQFNEDLELSQLAHEDIHAVVREGTHLNSVNDVHLQQETDQNYVIEWWAWRINLLVFSIALIALVIMLFWSPSYWLMLPLAIMVATFVAGFIFVLRMPNVHLDEFKEAVHHGEVLMMVDVPLYKVKQISQYIRQRHYEAVNGGSCWQI